MEPSCYTQASAPESPQRLLSPSHLSAPIEAPLPLQGRPGTSRPRQGLTSSTARRELTIAAQLAAVMEDSDESSPSVLSPSWALSALAPMWHSALVRNGDRS